MEVVMENRNQYNLDIREIVFSVLEIDSNITIVEDNEDLTKYGLDSMNVIQIVVELESRYDIEFPDEYLSIDSLITISDINNTLIEVKKYGCTN